MLWCVCRGVRAGRCPRAHKALPAYRLGGGSQDASGPRRRSGLRGGHRIHDSVKQKQQSNAFNQTCFCSERPHRLVATAQCGVYTSTAARGKVWPAVCDCSVERRHKVLEYSTDKRSTAMQENVREVGGKEDENEGGREEEFVLLPGYDRSLISHLGQANAFHW